MVARLQPLEARLESARMVANRFQVDISTGDADGRGRSFALRNGDVRITRGEDGVIDAHLASPNLDNNAELPDERVRAVASDAVARFGLDQDITLVFDRLLYASEAGGSQQGSGRLEAPRVTGAIAQFRQVINGLPVVSPDKGVVRISVDNDGQVTRVSSALYPVDSLVESARDAAPSPPPPGGTSPAEPVPEPTRRHEQALATELTRRLSSWTAAGETPRGDATVPDSTEVGYEIVGEEATVVVRSRVEVDFGNGYRKQYWIVAPL